MITKFLTSMQHHMTIYQFSTCEDNHVHVQVEHHGKMVDAVVDLKDFCSFLIETGNLRPIESFSSEGEHGGGGASTRGKA